jgi:hypothetical protein
VKKRADRRSRPWLAPCPSSVWYFCSPRENQELIDVVDFSTRPRPQSLEVAGVWVWLDGWMDESWLCSVSFCSAKKKEWRRLRTALSWADWAELVDDKGRDLWLLAGRHVPQQLTRNKEGVCYFFFFFNQILRLYGWGSGVVNQMKKSCESNRFWFK